MSEEKIRILVAKPGLDGHDRGDDQHRGADEDQGVRGLHTHQRTRYAATSIPREHDPETSREHHERRVLWPASNRKNVGRHRVSAACPDDPSPPPWPASR